MIKILFILMSIFYSSVAMADLCSFVSTNVADKAYNIISEQTEIYEYCSLCPNKETKVIAVKNVQKINPALGFEEELSSSYFDDKNQYMLSVDGKELDLAYTYYKKDNKYVNLGISSGCISEGQHGIKASLDELTPSSDTNDEDKEKEIFTNALMKEMLIFDKCVPQSNIGASSLSNEEMIKEKKLYADCIIEAIKEEIKAGFEENHQDDMIKYLEEAHNNMLSFYSTFYKNNKYCGQGCAKDPDMSLFQKEDKFLFTILSELIHLNVAKRAE